MNDQRCSLCSAIFLLLVPEGKPRGRGIGWVHSNVVGNTHCDYDVRLVNFRLESAEPESGLTPVVFNGCKGMFLWLTWSASLSVQSDCRYSVFALTGSKSLTWKCCVLMAQWEGGPTVAILIASLSPIPYINYNSLSYLAIWYWKFTHQSPEGVLGVRKPEF